MAKPLVWYIGASTRTPAAGAPAPTSRHRRAEHVVVHRGLVDQDHLRRPGGTAAADPVGLRRDDVGQVAATRAIGGGSSIHGRSSVPIVEVHAASITSSSRSRSQSGRSQRTGTGIAPSFQAATDASTRCSELGMAMPTRSPNPTRRGRAGRAPAHRSDGRARSTSATSRRRRARHGGRPRHRGRSPRTPAPVTDSCRARWPVRRRARCLVAHRGSPRTVRRRCCAGSPTCRRRWSSRTTGRTG